MQHNHDLQYELTNTTQHNQDLQIAFDNATQRSQDLQTAFDNATQRNHELQVERDNATQRNHELQAERDNAIQRNHELQAERDNATQRNHELQAEHDNATQRNHELQAELENYRAMAQADAAEATTGVPTAEATGEDSQAREDNPSEEGELGGEAESEGATHPAADTHEATTVAPGETSTSATDAALPWGAIITAVAFAIAAPCGVAIYYAISSCLASDGLDGEDELRHQQGEKAGSAATCETAEEDIERAQDFPRLGVVAVAAE